MALLYSGNLSVSQIEKRLGITLQANEREFLEKSRQAETKNLAPCAWHCYDMPFLITCGSRTMASKVADILRPHAGQAQEPIQIGIDKRQERERMATLMRKHHVARYRNEHHQAMWGVYTLIDPELGDTWDNREIISYWPAERMALTLQDILNASIVERRPC